MSIQSYSLTMKVRSFETKKRTGGYRRDLWEGIMSRKYIDCREHPSEVKCTVALSADTEEELLNAVIQHGVNVHGFEDTPELRKALRKEFKEGAPLA
jgi:hypothetical protein